MKNFIPPTISQQTDGLRGFLRALFHSLGAVVPSFGIAISFLAFSAGDVIGQAQNGPRPFQIQAMSSTKAPLAVSAGFSSGAHESNSISQTGNFNGSAGESWLEKIGRASCRERVLVSV